MNLTYLNKREWISGFYNNKNSALDKFTGCINLNAGNFVAE